MSKWEYVVLSAILMAVWVIGCLSLGFTSPYGIPDVTGTAGIVLAVIPPIMAIVWNVGRHQRLF